MSKPQVELKVEKKQAKDTKPKILFGKAIKQTIDPKAMPEIKSSTWNDVKIESDKQEPKLIEPIIEPKQ